jgi:hypothetical protein
MERTKCEGIAGCDCSHDILDVATAGMVSLPL